MKGIDQRILQPLRYHSVKGSFALRNRQSSLIPIFVIKIMFVLFIKFARYFSYNDLRFFTLFLLLQLDSDHQVHDRQDNGEGWELINFQTEECLFEELKQM